jgi:hypothetical protein
MVDETPLYAKILSWGLLASAGGAVKFLAAMLRTPEKMSAKRFLFLLGANVCISGFSGLIFALLFSTLSPDRTWQLIAAGIGGYLGTQLLDIIALTMTKKISDMPVPISQVIPIPASVDPASHVATEQQKA